MKHEGKPVWASKTLWFNLLSLVAIAAAAIGIPECSGDAWVDRTPDGICLTLSGEGLTAAVAFVMGVVNLVLRLVTTGPVSVRRRNQ